MDEAKKRFVYTSVGHPKLKRLDSESIRIFIRRYDAYRTELIARAQQLSGDGVISTEPVIPINIKCCIDPKQLQSAIDLGLIPGVDDYDKLDESMIRKYLDKKMKKSKPL